MKRETSVTGERAELDATTVALLEIVTNGSADVSAARAALNRGEVDGLEAERLCAHLRGMVAELVEQSAGRTHTEEYLKVLLATVIGAGIKAGLAVGRLQEAQRFLGAVTTSSPRAFEDCIARPMRGGRA